MRVNPYQAIYHSLNIPITKSVSRENAEEVARHLGFLHNTFGLVTRDLIKILSFKFPSQGTQLKKNYQKASNENSLRPLDQMKRRVENSGQMMQIQNSGSNYREDVSRSPIIFNKKRKNPVVVQIGLEDSEEVVNDQKSKQPEENPPDFDFLGQFAYDKTGNCNQQDKSTTVDMNNNILKVHLSKIFEKVSTKKKKESKNNQHSVNTQKPPSPKTNNLNESIKSQVYSPMISAGPFTSNNKLTFGNQNNKNAQQENGLIENSNVGDMNEQPSFLQEFEYKSEKMKPQPIGTQVSKMENQPQQRNKLWQLLRQKQTPEVFQISDDD